MNWVELAQLLVKTARGDKSQEWVNRKFGCNFNQVYRWEAGLKVIKWGDFVKLCAVCKLDLGGALRQQLSFEKEPESLSLLKHLSGSTKLGKFAEQLGVSRHIAKRWLSGESDPPLAAVLQLIHVFSNNLTAFLSHLIDINSIPELKHLSDKDNLARDLHWRSPMVAAAIRCFDLKQYLDAPRHIDGFLAATLGVSANDETLLIENLERAGAILWNGDKYQVTSKTLDTRGTYEQGKQIKEYWLAKAMTQLQQKRDVLRPEAFGYLVFSADRDVQQQVFDKYIEFYNSVRAITSEQAAPPDRICCLNIQLFDIGHEHNAIEREA